MFPGSFRHLRLMALDPYDISLSKLERNSQKDRDDVRFLSRSIPFDLATLQQRYEKELRWPLGRPEREDLTMKLWMEMLSE
jgi:U3 small nucleolar RNA-associated protein 14